MKIDEHTWRPIASDTCSGQNYPAAARGRSTVEVNLEISDVLWSEEAIRGLADHWLVPTIVESIVRDLFICEGTS